jgi:hypothetical protein
MGALGWNADSPSSRRTRVFDRSRTSGGAAPQRSIRKDNLATLCSFACNRRNLHPPEIPHGGFQHETPDRNSCCCTAGNRVRHNNPSACQRGHLLHIRRLPCRLHRKGRRGAPPAPRRPGRGPSQRGRQCKRRRQPRWRTAVIFYLSGALVRSLVRSGRPPHSPLENRSWPRTSR